MPEVVVPLYALFHIYRGKPGFPFFYYCAVLWSAQVIKYIIGPWSLWPRQNSCHFAMTFPSTFYWIEMFELRIKFHWILFLGVTLSIFQHWFRWLGAGRATSYKLMAITTHFNFLFIIRFIWIFSEVERWLWQNYFYCQQVFLIFLHFNSLSDVSV